MNKKIDKDKKEKYIKVLCTEEQKEEILVTAKKCKKSASKFLLGRGLGYHPKALSHRKGNGLAGVNTRVSGECNSLH